MDFMDRCPSTTPLGPDASSSASENSSFETSCYGGVEKSLILEVFQEFPLSAGNAAYSLKNFVYKSEGSPQAARCCVFHRFLRAGKKIVLACEISLWIPCGFRANL